MQVVSHEDLEEHGKERRRGMSPAGTELVLRVGPSEMQRRE